MGRKGDSERTFTKMNSKEVIVIEEHERRVNESVVSAIASFFPLNYVVHANENEHAGREKDSDMKGKHGKQDDFFVLKAAFDGFFDTKVEADARVDSAFENFMASVFEPLEFSDYTELSPDVLDLYADATLFIDNPLVGEQELSLSSIMAEITDSDGGAMAMTLFQELEHFGLDGHRQFIEESAKEAYWGTVPDLIEIGLSTTGIRPNEIRREMAEGTMFEDFNNDMKPYADIGDIIIPEGGHGGS